MDVLLQRLVEAAADDEELVAEDRRAEVAALDVGDCGQVAPPASARQIVRYLCEMDQLRTNTGHIGHRDTVKKSEKCHCQQ